MEDTLIRIFENMIDRVSGPMNFRLVLQPVMAAIYAIISGLKDAEAGKPAYFWALFTQADHRREMLHDGWKSVGKVFLLAMILDVIYQFIVQRWVYPFEVVLTAIILAIVPYILLRGPIDRIASLIKRPRKRPV